MNEMELDALGYTRMYDYTQYSHDNHVNVIPEEAFKRLVSDTFRVITDILRETYGPYGSTLMRTEQNETTTTKDGYNLFNAIGFSHQYKQKVYLTIKKIIDRVNHNVGDGTTSCILLAEKIFNKVQPMFDTPVNKRNGEAILNDIENMLQMIDFTDYKKKHPLTEKSLKNLLMLASNYDETLVNILINAMEPQSTEEGIITSMRDVIPDTSTTYETSANVSYSIDYLPGDYRCRVNMNNNDIATMFATPVKVKVVVYDHTFGEPEWHYFMEEYDKDTPTLIVARSFSHTFMNNEYVRYARDRTRAGVGISVFLCQMEGDYVQDELQDFAAIVGTDVRDVHMFTVKHEELPEALLEVYKYNCLCVHNAAVPVSHIENLQIELEQEKSYVRKNILQNRINALRLDKKDSIISVKAGTSLELNMIADKIDDCVAIAKSAFEHGIAPNMLFFGCKTVDNMYDALSSKYESDFVIDIIKAIDDSISELLVDIYESKYGKLSEDEDINVIELRQNTINQLITDFYVNQDGDYSYDIINEKHVKMRDLPTSAQYDIEVLVASLSIVKYLLSSRALIFDSHLLTPQGDQGHFIQSE